jgi:hypothetical protein
VFGKKLFVRCFPQIKKEKKKNKPKFQNVPDPYFRVGDPFSGPHLWILLKEADF